MIAKIAILIALLAGAFAGGWALGNNHAYAAGYSACTKADAATLKDAHTLATQAHAAVTKVRDELTKLKTDHAAALVKAQAMLGLRNTQIQAAHRAFHTQLKHLRAEVAHDTDCSTLAHLPVCDRVARGLWPAANASSPGPDRD